MAGLGEIPGPVVYIVQIEKMMEVHMRFFSSEETRIYFAKISQKLKDEVEQMSDVEINTCDLQEWKEYLYDKYQVIPLVLFEESIKQTLVDTKVKKYNHFYGSLPFEQECFLVDGVRIIFSIPFDGGQELFWLQPTSCVWDSYEVEDFHEPRGKECGSFVLEFEYSKRELEEKNDKMLSFVADHFENRFRTFRTMVGNVNSEVLNFNKRLEEYALKCLQERKARAASLSFISKMLEIPLNESSNSPNTKPILLERVVNSRKNYVGMNLPIYQHSYQH